MNNKRKSRGKEYFFKKAGRCCKVFFVTKSEEIQKSLKMGWTKGGIKGKEDILKGKILKKLLHKIFNQKKSLF